MTRQPRHTRALRVLVVDDDALLRTLLRTTFEHAELVVTEAADTREAQRALEVEMPDVIVLDVDLPGVDGVTFARSLRKGPVTAATGIVLLTGTDLETQAGLDAGASAVVRKPFSPLDLLAAVEQAAGAQATRRLVEAPQAHHSDQLLVYAGDLRRLLDVERRQRRTIARLYGETLGALASALESRDLGTGAHSARVQQYALALTRAIAPELASDASVGFGYLLHDVGKIGISDTILLKPGPLDPDERAVMQTHTTLGAQILAGVDLLEGHGIGIVRHHHERWDGNGYPDGLAGEEIPLPARVFAVADTLDAITSNRPYRPAQPWADAVAELDRGAGTQFDPDVVAMFHEVEPALAHLAA